ncbi:MAG: hypothetical protein LJE65_08815, partial [Desulfobacteraceae bacterium]|nr:hypothetical protein [Desulfobacteraceae bacterium]
HDWYLILGSGPTDVDGTSTQNAKLAVIDLQDLVDKSAPFRIEDVAPNSTTEKGTYTLDANGWVSDLITIDFDLDANYMADAVYFGTIAGDYYDDVNDTGGWGGAMYRLVTRKADSDGNQIKTEPHEWADLLTAQTNATGPNPKKLIDLGNLSTDNPGISLSIGQPISASPAAGTDGKNFWIYFGTGRFLYDDDKIDTSSNAQNSFYGIKEPMIYSDASGDCVGEFTWETVEYSGTQNTTPGSQGLVRADQILVTAASTGDAATLTCEGGGAGCLPDSGNVDTFAELQDWIAGTGFGCGAGDSSGTDGWYRNFPLDRERNLGQGTLLGGLMTYTTFQPYSSVCQSEGLAYLYGVFYQTGTAYFEPVFITDTDDGIDDSGNVKTTVDLGRGLASTPNLHVGKQEGAKAFVQTSTGTIVEVPQPNLPIKGKTARHSWEVVR